MRMLPYQLKTEFGEEFDIEFPLHDQTASAVDVAQLLSAVLEAVDKELRLMRDPSNGDVLQAMAMALAVRTRIVPVPFDVAKELGLDLTQMSLNAVGVSEGNFRTVGNA